MNDALSKTFILWYSL